MKLLRPSLTIALIVSTLTFSTSALAAVKPGVSCKKLGITATSGKDKFTCIASGKKLIWSKGSKINPSIPVSSPAPKVEPLASPSPVVSQTEKPEPFQPTSFDDLIVHPESMPYWAWKKSSQVINTTEIQSSEIEVHIGPNTKLPHELTAKAILKSSKLYAGFALPKTVHAIYYTHEDVAWAQQEFAKYALRPMGDEAKNSCRSETTCWGGMAEIDLKGNAILIFGVMNLGKSDSNHTTGSLESHEFTHAIQGSQFVGTQKEFSSYCCTKAYMPWWMVEGGAEFSQAASTFPNSYRDYLDERVRDTNQILANSEDKFTISWIEKFLEPSARSMWADPLWDGRIYDLGYLANEAFVALKGPGISMQLFRDVALGSTWQEAFAKNFGQTWDEALPSLSKAIKAQLAK